MSKLALLSLAFLCSCTSRPTSADVCKRLESAGLAKACRDEAAGPMSSRAANPHTAFDIPAGKTGQVLSCASDDDYDATVKAFEAAAMLAGPHRYGSRKARIFVQLASATPPDVGAKVESLVDGL